MHAIYEEWLKHSYYKEELQLLSSEEIQDRFYQAVPFGTGGMRGKLGAGTNRINIHTIRLVSEGLARQIKSKGPLACARGVVIAYDTRHFSQEFAYETAGVLHQHGIHTYVFTESRPTPELSFAIRYFNAFAGVVITASHNPKQYNGFKVYGEDGAQLTPQFADEITTHMQQVENIFDIAFTSVKALRQADNFVEVLEYVDKPYIQAVVSNLSNPSFNKDMAIVYTPLHGSGLVPTQQALQAAGFTNIHVVEEQAIQDGAFPTVTYPNPEEAGAFKLAIDLGKKVNANLLLATDPDADRLGVAVWNGSAYQLLNGNQLGALLLNFIASTKEFASNAVMVKTIVTSEFGAAIAKAHSIQTENTLTGFKFIAEKIAEWEQTGEKQFVFGYEESYGYLAGDFVRDKDAVQIALLTAEMAAYYHETGQTLLDVLQSLYEQYGFYKETLISKTYEGLSGQKQIQAIMAAFRQDAPIQFGSLKVEKLEDYSVGNVNGLPKADVLKFILSNDAWLCVRPSGTEPKCKFYIGVKGETMEVGNASLKEIETALMVNLEKISLQMK